ncbi:MAG TPA: urease subunit beta [Thermomicrobiales bacterium]|nr:urease subunit beta [Thermomicrobiales bacterium]
MTGDEGRGDYPGTRVPRGQRHPHSGPGHGSPPRRPGTGERQAPGRPGAGDRPLIPGEVLYADGPVVINAGKDVVRLRVTNTGDRPIQVGSHYHFAEVNPGLAFDRQAAWGRRLNVLSGGSVRFEPGAVEEVELIPIGGERIVAGLRGECGGKLDGGDRSAGV